MPTSDNPQPVQEGSFPVPSETQTGAANQFSYATAYTIIGGPPILDYGGAAAHASPLNEPAAGWNAPAYWQAAPAGFASLQPMSHPSALESFAEEAADTPFHDEYIKYYDPEQGGYVIKKKKKTHPVEAPLPNGQKRWYDRLDEYPSNQTEHTHCKNRVCVVTGLKGGESIVWRWRNPYWVKYEGWDEFNGRMARCSATDRYVLAHETGYAIDMGQCSHKWLKENGYISFKGPNGLQWDKKDNMFTIHIPTSDKPNLKTETPFDMSRTYANSYIKCEKTGRFYHKNLYTRVVVSVNESFESELKMMSPHMLLYHQDVKQCHCCGGLFLPELVVEVSPSAWECKKCNYKQMESKVIRSHDDSTFLKAIPDMVEVRRAGKVTKRRNPRMFGVEAEVGFNTGVRAAVAFDAWDTLGRDFCYMKHDGSITNPELKGHTKFGFEIVSAPAGLNVHRERWKKLVNMKHFKLLRSWDTGTCGFHVHVSREALTTFQIGRILVFVNHPNNRYFMEVVAGRSSGKYSKYIPKDVSDGAKQDPDKYTAVRTNKEHTIEFRIFRGTINYRHMMRNLEFVDAVCDFCSPCMCSVRELADFRVFIAYVEANRDKYPLLAEWMQTVDMIAKKTLPRALKDLPPMDEVLSDSVKKQLKLLKIITSSSDSIETAMAKTKELPKAKKNPENGDEEDDEEEGDEDGGGDAF